MTIFGRHLWHSWETIFLKDTKNFLGEEIPREYHSLFRKCKECGKIQQYFFDSQGGVWEALDSYEVEVIAKKIYIEDGKLYLDYKRPGSHPSQE
jgi:hypothetical protein